MTNSSHGFPSYRLSIGRMMRPAASSVNAKARTGMSAPENKRLLQNIFTELAKSNSKPFVEAMAADFRWTMFGGSKWSRTYESKAEVLDELFPALRRKIDRITT